MFSDKPPIRLPEQFNQPPESPDQAYNFLVQVRDQSMQGLADDQMIDLASKVGIEVVDGSDERFERGEIIVRQKNMTDPTEIAYYSWMMPQSSEELNRLVSFFRERVALEMAKPEAERNRELLAIEVVLASKKAETKGLYLTLLRLRELKKKKKERQLKYKEGKMKYEEVIRFCDKKEKTSLWDLVDTLSHPRQSWITKLMQKKLKGTKPH
ncbi:hypothetical protein HY612_02315 [Candidatus Roizmanbacteria bacterium]|nr:hypothetical protein [Candidatus Roizmanbacteria bacterium]